MDLRKVVHLVRRFSPSEWGGVESAVLQLCQQLEAKGIASPIFTTDMLSQPGEDSLQGISIKRFRYCFPWFGLDVTAKRQLERKGGSPLSLCLFRALFREREVSLIHTHVQLRLGGIARTVARWRGIPYVVSIHGGYLTLPEGDADRMQEPVKNKWEWGKLFGWLLGSRRVLEDADAIICVGLDEYKAMQARFPLKRVVYLPNGVDPTPFAQADPTLFHQAIGLKKDEPFILCVSRIDYQKNQLLLVRAFARFLRQFPNYRLVLIGPISVESYHQELLAEAQRLGISDNLFIIPGYAPDNPLLASAYKAADFFVLPSSTEPFGIVILEAWAAGLPVLASRVGGIPGFTEEGKNALLFESGDEEMLLKKMILMAEDSALRKRFALAGLESVKAYDWSSITDRLIALYSELVL